MVYPVKFEPIYKEKIWGGEKLSKLFGRKLPFYKTGESWDISCRENDMGIVSNGILAGNRFDVMISLSPKEYLGRLKESKKFPLLVKIIDANDTLSIQVHPNDEYAREHENEAIGKNELWYIIDSGKESYIYIGLKPQVTSKSFEDAIRCGKVEECLNRMEINQGDIIYIPAGIIHAIPKDVVVLEIQQNSDTTYRVYDYNRLGLDGKPRKLHTSQSMEVINFNQDTNCLKLQGSVTKTSWGDYTNYIAHGFVFLTVYNLLGTFEESISNDIFSVISCIHGSFSIDTGNFVTNLIAGESAFMPAALLQYTLTGEGKLIRYNII